MAACCCCCLLIFFFSSSSLSAANCVVFVPHMVARLCMRTLDLETCHQRRSRPSRQVPLLFRSL
jgi:hypothetical protein